LENLKGKAVGRQRHTWEDNIKIKLGRIVLEGVC
jgi:hypothetical protein